ncbi:phage neck terminator protein [Paenibacillus tyrfis]|uniref:Phage neck terminator protein gp12-like domain-containing protein n=1 Tax=Paenibacillus tyrfis TaxID=1501230 RepID=A0A081NWQ1_9BACL|nr:hypothetical protein [Paenibacillus tyrfis]KEQ22874.1 hypothetical protein ET33_21250 [Paenibacillus tyrfis]
MIPFKAIRSALVRGMAGFVGCKVIEMNVAGDMPEYPFITYEFPDIGGSGGLPVVVIEGDKKKTMETVNISVSFLSYASSKFESVENALKARDWFLADGVTLLMDTVNVAIIEVGEVQNRDVKVGLEWERRNGFDVELRTLNTIKTPKGTDTAEFIETAIVKEMNT